VSGRLDTYALAAQLQAMRAQLAAMAATVDAALMLLSAPPEPSDVQGDGCSHPSDKRVDTTTMASECKSWLCTACGFQHSDS
jgi:hypothetical protein